MYQKIMVIGRATADAKLQKAKKSDTEYSTFSLAVNEGEDKVTFFDVVVFSKQRSTAAEFVQKGRLVGVEGRIERGNKGYFNVVASRVLFLDSMPKALAEKARSSAKKSK